MKFCNKGITKKDERERERKAEQTSHMNGSFERKAASQIFMEACMGRKPRMKEYLVGLWAAPTNHKRSMYTETIIYQPGKIKTR